MDVESRFWSKVDKTDGCWPWRGTIASDGYGRIRGHIGDAYRTALIHRVAYELLVGPIPEGMTIYHTCHNRALDCPGGTSCVHRRCVNPEHLEPTPGGVNTLRSPTQLMAINARKSHCKWGHPLDGINRSQRYCKECNRKRTREQKMAQRRAAGIPAGRGVREKMKTHCPQGHPYDETNTRATPQGSRVCRTCERAKGRRNYAARKSQAQPR